MTQAATDLDALALDAVRKAQQEIDNGAGLVLEVLAHRHLLRSVREADVAEVRPDALIAARDRAIERAAQDSTREHLARYLFATDMAIADGYRKELAVRWDSLDARDRDPSYRRADEILAVIAGKES